MTNGPALAVKPIEWRWQNFAPYEIRCKGSGTLCLNEAAMDALQRLRTALGCPLRVNSAYRCPDYNRKIGGAPDSRHLYAEAFDIGKTEWELGQLLEEAAKAGFLVAKQYTGFVHLDMGPHRGWGIDL